MSISLKDELFSLKDRLDTIEAQLSEQVKEIEDREEKWKRMDNKIENILNSQGEILKFNIGGKVYTISAYLIKSKPDTLFNHLYNRLGSTEEIFIDRSSKYSKFIINFLKTNEIILSEFKKDELSILKEEANFYNIIELEKSIQDRLKEVEILSFVFSGEYVFNGKTAGTNKIDDIKDKSLTKGICTDSPGWIEFELNSDWEFESIEIGGWKGDSSLWYSDNGAGASILTSLDKKTWKKVGTIPYGYGNKITTVKLSKSSARYIKFEHSSYLGIGYLYIKKIEN